MATINLTPQEKEILEDILLSYLSDLRMEIADTDQMDFREKLKNKEAFIKDLLQRLTD